MVDNPLLSLFEKPKRKPAEGEVPTTKTELDSLLGPSQKGKQAAIGMKFEKEIEYACKVYEDEKLAYIQFFHVPSIFIPKTKKGGGFMARTKKTGFDFIGGVISTKETVFVETKTTRLPYIEVGQEKVGIKIHQMEKMAWLESVGFNAFFLWQIRDRNVVYKFTCSQLVSAVEGRKSISALMCEENRFPKVLKAGRGDKEVWDFLNLL